MLQSVADRSSTVRRRPAGRGDTVGAGRILVFDDDSFDEQVARLRGPILVDFWAAWCAPCKEVEPALVELASELAGRAWVVKIDVEESGALVSRFGIRSIPTLVVLRDGRVVDQLVGAAPKAEIRRLVERHLDG
jgi:thioredoxin 1